MATKLTGNITREKLQAWIDAHPRYSHIGLYEVNGLKGVYRRNLGPAADFSAKGQTWRDVAKAIGAL